MLGRSRIHTRARGSGAGAGSTTTTDLPRLIALSPSLLIWPAQGAGWQGTSGGTLAASGQPLGLGADLSQLQGKTLSEWLAAAPELVTNGDFATDTGWTKGTGITIAGGKAVFTSVSVGQLLTQSLTVTAGTTYAVTYTIGDYSAGGVAPRFTGGSTVAGTTQIAAGTYTEIMVAVSGNNVLEFRASFATASLSVDNVSIKALPGNHLRAGTWASPSDSARGLFQNNAINFDGVNDYYSLLNAISITTNMTVVRAFKRASAGINNVGLGGSGNPPYDALWLTDNNTYLKLGDLIQTSSSTSTGTGSFVLTSQRNASAQSSRRNGAAIAAPASAPAVTGTLTAFGLRTSNYNSGEISFLALFPTELTGANLALVEQIAAATNGATLA